MLAALPLKDWERSREHFHEMQFAQGDVLYEAGAAMRRLYFPTTAVVSSIAILETGAAVEVATMGPEGMMEVEAILGSETALNRQMIQIPGAALAIGHDEFERLQRDLPAFRKELFAYAQAFLAEVLQSVACNGVHAIEQRAARWILTCRDRSGSDRFHLTQEFLSEMLGVSRQTVSVVARTLQRADLIRYRRGVVTIVDRAGLEEAACECYGVISRQFVERLKCSVGIGRLE